MSKAKENEEIKQIREDLLNQLIEQNKFGKHFESLVEDYINFEKLKRKMLLLGYRDYPDACSEITKIFEKGMEAGERSETICDN